MVKVLRVAIRNEPMPPPPTPHLHHPGGKYGNIEIEIEYEQYLLAFGIHCDVALVCGLAFVFPAKTMVTGWDEKKTHGQPDKNSN